MSPTGKTTISRLAKRGAYDTETIYAILDEALVCTLSYAVDGQPFSIPTGFCRIGDKVYVHGSVGSHFLRELVKGRPVCLSVTHIDALVLARSAFDHSVNYRSVVVFSRPRLVEDETERWQVLEVFTNKMVPGRWEHCRQPSESEMRKTMIISFSLDEASAKVRSGPPIGEEEDKALPYWSGTIPLITHRGEPMPDEDTASRGINYPA